LGIIKIQVHKSGEILCIKNNLTDNIMNYKIKFLFAVLIFNYCIHPLQILAAQSVVQQDIEIYLQGKTFIARGQLDLKILKSSGDAAEVIQYAIDAMPDDGGEVLLNRGCYNLNQPISLKNRVWLHGKGRGTLLQVTPSNTEGVGIMCKGLKGTVVSDLAIKSKLTDSAKAGLVIDDCGDCQFRNIFCQGFSQYGIWMRNGSFLCEISGCQLADNDSANIYCENLTISRGGKFLPNLINNCTIYGGGHGIECEKSLVINIVGCIVFQTKQYGFYVHTGSNSVLISGCRTYQIEKEAVVIESAHEANISSNIFCWHRGHGIVIDGVAWATVTANNIIDSGVRSRDGSKKIGIVLKNESRGIQITGNSLFNWGNQVPMLNGIQEDATCYNNQMVSNNINYFVGSDIVSNGTNTLVKDNVSAGSKAFIHGKVPYPDFDTLEIEKFFND
jgi:hypothetical protein